MRFGQVVPAPAQATRFWNIGMKSDLNPTTLEYVLILVVLRGNMLDRGTYEPDWEGALLQSWVRMIWNTAFMKSPAS